MVRSKSKKQQEPEMRLINAAMILAARRRWRDIKMADIASEAKMPIADALSHSRSKVAILGALGRHIDRVVLNDLHMDPDIGDSPKDRLFELMSVVLMLWRTIGPVWRASCRYDFSLFAIRRVCHIQNAMALTLEAAGVSATGPCGFLRQQGLGAIYIYCLSVWFNDETDDMSATMAALDRALTLADNLIARRVGHGSSETGSDTA